MDHYLIWEVISYSWTEIGLEDDDYPKYAKELALRYKTWKEINAIVLRDVCAYFAVISFLILPCMLWVIMPDWGYTETFLRQRIEKWYSRPYLLHFVNPFRILGYPIALLFSSSVRRKLRTAFEQEKST